MGWPCLGRHFPGLQGRKGGFCGFCVGVTGLERLGCKDPQGPLPGGWVVRRAAQRSVPWTRARGAGTGRGADWAPGKGQGTRSASVKGPMATALPDRQTEAWGRGVISHDTVPSRPPPGERGDSTFRLLT